MSPELQVPKGRVGIAQGKALGNAKAQPTPSPERASQFGASGLRELRAYIIDQKNHHGRRTFEDEFLSLLRRNEVEYDPEHLWDEEVVR